MLKSRHVADFTWQITQVSGFGEVPLADYNVSRCLYILLIQFKSFQEILAIFLLGCFDVLNKIVVASQMQFSPFCMRLVGTVQLFARGY
jgi:hypothetical protein